MKIYFSCSITGGRSDQQAYQVIVESLLTKGHQVPTAMLSSRNVQDFEEQADSRSTYLRDVNWVMESEALVAEVSTPSHGVGYELALALLENKPVLCCYQKDKKVSKMILGNTHPNLTIMVYEKLEQIPSILSEWLSKLITH